MVTQQSIILFCLLSMYLKCSSINYFPNSTVAIQVRADEGLNGKRNNDVRQDEMSLTTMQEVTGV